MRSFSKQYIVLYPMVTRSKDIQSSLCTGTPDELSTHVSSQCMLYLDKHRYASKLSELSLCQGRF